MDDDEGRERARRWLAEEGVLQIGEDSWTSGDGRLTTNEVAHTWTRAALEDPDLDPAGRLRLALGFLDLLDDYWVTCEIRFDLVPALNPEHARLLWDAYRRRLEAPEPAEPVTYSLWVDWFEDRATAEAAFAEVLGDDVEELRARDRLHEAAQDPLCRRVRRVLEISGPVPWPVKHPVFQALAGIPALHAALFQGLRAGWHDAYGDLEPRSAHALLRRLKLPEDTEGLVHLRTALEAGRSNRYRESP
ncbi:hypothetical protein [Nonomuraea sp. LPB2021202275-12-8]|uniref:hypothetical protein n=1 Tax=Nonomuraea sp. LPB2021202275-12-8 TaxID=3120159 RepID=UPI00300C276F